MYWSDFKVRNFQSQVSFNKKAPQTNTLDAKVLSNVRTKSPSYKNEPTLLLY